MKNKEERFDEAKNIISEWINKQGHDRCWYYPELFNKLLVLFEIDSNIVRNLPSLKDFKEGCERFQKDEYSL